MTTNEDNNQKQPISMWLARASNPETSPLKDLSKNLSQEEVLKIYESIKEEAEKAAEEQMKMFEGVRGICDCACCRKY